jgi:uncharacterized protein (DUF1330 family)
MTNSALVLTFVQPKPSEIDAFHGYVGAATELAREAGGAPSSRFGVRSVLGDAPAAVFGLATFPTAEAATTMFESDAYKALVPARDGSVQSLNAYVVDAAPVSSLPDPDGVYMVVVGAPNPEAKEDLEAYQRVATQLVGKHGGKPVVKMPIASQVAGKTPAAFMAVAQFPSADAVEAFFNDADYKPIIETRNRALPTLNVYVTQ